MVVSTWSIDTVKAVQWLSVLTFDHLLQAQPGGDSVAHGRADEAFGVGGHEVDVLRGGELGGADHVALVLPVRVVDGR